MRSYYLSSNFYFQYTHILYKTSIYLDRQDIVFYYACTKNCACFFHIYNKNLSRNCTRAKKIHMIYCYHIFNF